MSTKYKPMIGAAVCIAIAAIAGLIVRVTNDEGSDVRIDMDEDVVTINNVLDDNVGIYEGSTNWRPPYITVPPATQTHYEYCQGFEGVLPDICDIYLADLCPAPNEFCSDSITMVAEGQTHSTAPSTVAPPATIPYDTQHYSGTTPCPMWIHPDGHDCRRY